MWISRYAVSAILSFPIKSTTKLTTTSRFSFSSIGSRRTTTAYYQYPLFESSSSSSSSLAFAFITRPHSFRSIHSIRLMSYSSSSSSSTTNDLETPQDEHVIASNLKQVRIRMEQALLERNQASSLDESSQSSVRLIAVSKTKPIEMLLEAYHKGNQRNFGENYVQELISKVPLMPTDVQWHFIGPLQSNKASTLVKAVGLKQLACIESVDSIKLASKLNRAVESLILEKQEEKKKTKEEDDTNNSSPTKLNIFIQVNTSLEDTKSGLENIQDVIQLALDITKTCPYLQIRGLMTIGAPGDYTCFDTLVTYRKEVAHALDLSDETQLELSMGMSNDFEEAIKRGSTNIRVGSTIFGERIYTT